MPHSACRQTSESGSGADPLPEFLGALADAVGIPCRQLLPAPVIRLPGGANFGTGAQQEGDGLLQADTFDPSEIRQHHPRRAVDAGGAMDVDPVALAQQTPQPAHRRRQAAPLVGGIEIAQGTAFHGQADPAAVPDLPGIVDPLLLQALVVLQRQNGGHAGFHAEGVQIARLARTAPDDPIMTNDVPVQAPVRHCGTSRIRGDCAYSPAPGSIRSRNRRAPAGAGYPPSQWITPAGPGRIPSGDADLAGIVALDKKAAIASFSLTAFIRLDARERQTDRRQIRTMRHAAGVRYFDFTPVMIVALASVVGARDLAIGTGDTELDLFAGMLAAVVISLRVFLFRGAGKAN